MKNHLFIATLALFTLSLPSFIYAQNYIEGEVIVKYKNAEFQTTAQGIQLILPSSPALAPVSTTITPRSLTPALPPCKVNEPTEEFPTQEPTDEPTDDPVQVAEGGFPENIDPDDNSRDGSLRPAQATGLNRPNE
jgi:hypothetical protein